MAGTGIDGGIVDRASNSRKLLPLDKFLDIFHTCLGKAGFRWRGKGSPGDPMSNSDQSVSAHDVAAYILAKQGGMTVMKLQKLVYYAQAWSLVWDEKPLFLEQIEAWANGPVVHSLYEYHKGKFRVTDWRCGDPGSLNETQQETVNVVLDYYGNKPALWLSDLTHREFPWRRTRRAAGLRTGERGTAVISHDLIAEYYSSLSDSGDD